MKLLLNSPLDATLIGGLVENKEDLQLMWPEAEWPFNPIQWKEALNPTLGHRSLFLVEDNNRIGHIALRQTEEVRVLRVCFIYLRPEYRQRGLCRTLLALTTEYCLSLGATRLTLAVRDFNTGALNCYLKSGFSMDSKVGSRIEMSKAIS